jgi:CxxC-x17-CxxC domain-containing protein
MEAESPQVPFNKELTYLGVSTYRDKNTLFGIKRKDRRQHVYILGKSGTGKSVLMFNMIIQNIQNGEGVCLVDPHGENVEAVLSAIPPHRLKDVIYFNPADQDHHIGFNVLELEDPQYKHLVASGLMGIFTKIWANAWSARMEYILNNAILALLDTPGTTLLGIPRMLVDKDYRQKIINNLKDPVIKAFWVHEYEAWQDKFRNEAIAPIQNKVGQFLSTSIIRNVVGQQKSTINIFDMMNEGKIFLVNVSKGRIGEDNSGLLGGMIITKIQLAAMERVRIPEETRRDFYLYVDEFQNFVTDAFAGILSEARKYRLNLTVAHQYTAQLIADKSTAVRDAVFGNVGTMIIFRVGADDADFLEKEFEPEFIPQDIVNLPNYKVYLKLMIDGVTSRPFSAKTLPQMVKGGDKKVEEAVIEMSRKLYCRPREVVEREITEWSGMSLGDIVAPSGERFKFVCSNCGKEDTVPFKPEAGRPIYCRDCMEKIKSGELKVKGGGGQREEKRKESDATFYQPLAALGIEFKPTGGQVPFVSTQRPIMKQPPRPMSAPRPMATTRPMASSKPMAGNSALRDALSKIKAGEGNAEEVRAVPKVEPISLNSLKDKMSVQSGANNKDRGATSENINKLKEIITEKVPEKIQTPNPTPPPAPQPVPPPAPTPVMSASPASKPVKEVPEDVLKKVLE